MENRAFFRLGAVSLVLGTAFGIVFNLMHPRDVDFDNLAESTLNGAALSSQWTLIHFGLAVAVFLGILGLASFSRSIGGDSGTAFSRLGFVAALVGGMLLLVTIALDGVAVKTFADVFYAGGKGAEAAFLSAQSLLALNNGIFSLGIFAFFGITNVLFGLAVSMGEGYPKWFGWFAVLFGILGVITGTLFYYDGSLTSTTLYLFTAASLLSSVWALVAGVFLWRKAAA